MLDRCVFAHGSYWPGFFSQDIMKATAYKYAHVNRTRHQQLSLVIIDRPGKRRFIIGRQWQTILSSRFAVCSYRIILYLECKFFVPPIGEFYLYSTN